MTFNTSLAASRRTSDGPGEAAAFRGYQARIHALAPTFAPRLIEAYMRNEHGTLDALAPDAFAAEVKIAASCVAADPSLAELLAQSYGL